MWCRKPSEVTTSTASYQKTDIFMQNNSKNIRHGLLLQISGSSGQVIFICINLKKKKSRSAYMNSLGSKCHFACLFFFVCFVLHFIVSDGCSSESREKQKSRGSDPWNATVPVNGDRKHHKERQKIRHAKLHMTGFHLIIVVFKVVWILKYINHSLLWIFVLFSDAL